MIETENFSKKEDWLEVLQAFENLDSSNWSPRFRQRFDDVLACVKSRNEEEPECWAELSKPPNWNSKAEDVEDQGRRDHWSKVWSAVSKCCLLNKQDFDMKQGQAWTVFHGAGKVSKVYGRWIKTDSIDATIPIRVKEGPRDLVRGKLSNYGSCALNRRRAEPEDFYVAVGEAEHLNSAFSGPGLDFIPSRMHIKIMKPTMYRKLIEFELLTKDFLKRLLVNLTWLAKHVEGEPATVRNANPEKTPADCKFIWYEWDGVASIHGGKGNDEFTFGPFVILDGLVSHHNGFMVETNTDRNEAAKKLSDEIWSDDCRKDWTSEEVLAELQNQLNLLNVDDD